MQIGKQPILKMVKKTVDFCFQDKNSAIPAFKIVAPDNIKTILTGKINPAQKVGAQSANKLYLPDQLKP